MVYSEPERSFPRLYGITDFNGRKIEVPVAEEDDNPYFAHDQAAISENTTTKTATSYCEVYCRKASATVPPHRLRPRSSLSAALSTGRRAATRKAFIYERRIMLNPILCVQSLNRRHFAGFRRAGLDLLTHANMQRAVTTILGEPGKLVQSMYFDGNPVTWPHQDTYYLDAEEIGRMTAAWVAAEDIAPGAGRFFVYPKSHLIDMTKNGGDFDIAFHHQRYKALVEQVIREQALVCRAPALSKGDVLFWAAKTIHGSLRTTQPSRSRRSFTAHFIPDRSRFLQFQTRVRPLKTELVNGIRVHHPKDLSKAANRAVFFAETRFPRTFQIAKRAAIKLITR